MEGKSADLGDWRSVEVTIWICPNCDSYYASSSVGNLLRIWNTDSKGKRTFTRSRCPNRDCAEQGVHREPVKVLIEQKGDQWRATIGVQ